MKEPNRPITLEDVAWVFNHVKRYKTDPIAAHDWESGERLEGVAVTSDTPVTGLHPTLLLTTTGRKSGEPRSIPLLYQPCGEGFILVASAGGEEKNPAWYANLLTNPRCEVVAGKITCTATARTLSGEEREKYWEWMARFWPDYEIYQSRTSRILPVVILVAETVKLTAPSGV